MSSSDGDFKNLLQLFDLTSFEIPPYQRGYQWEGKQLKDFWEDLTELKKGEFHYTGVITVKLSSGEGKIFKSYRVIDGQQRLITALLLLKVLIEKLEEGGIKWIGERGEEVKLEELKERFLVRRRGRLKREIFRTITFSDPLFQKVFDREVLGLEREPVGEETLYTFRLKKGLSFFKQQVEKLSEREITELLLKLITQFIFFSIYFVNSKLSEFNLFETLNYRGKPLSRLELLKNRLLYLISHLSDQKYSPGEIEELKRKVQEAWGTLYKYFGKNPKNLLREDDFLRDHSILYFGYSKLEKSKDYLLEEYFTLGNLEGKGGRVGYLEIEEYLSNLIKGGIGYYYLWNPEKGVFPEGIRVWLERLGALGFGNFTPLLIGIVGEYLFEKEKFGEKEIGQMEELLRLIEWFGVVVVVLQRRRSDIGKKEFYKIAHWYNLEKDLEGVLRRIERKIKEYGSKERVIQRLSDDLWGGFFQEHWSSLGIVKYILGRYHENLATQFRECREIWEIFENLSLEHILPKKWKKQQCWKEMFQGIPEEEVKNYLHSIGNLVLTSRSKNSAIKNICFPGKRERYRSGNLLEVEISQQEKWGPIEIYNRGVKILRFISREWELNFTEEEIGKLLNINPPK